jgi:ATP-dependent Clp protease ATP-binding subunit ClpX
VAAIAEESIKRRVGARGLRIILEEMMLDLMYTVPSNQDIKQLVVDEKTVESRIHPIEFKKAG